MKTECQVLYPTIFALATLVFLIGCAGPSLTERNAETGVVSRSVSAREPVYEIYHFASVIAGKLNTYEGRSVLGAVSFDHAANRILWKSNELLYLQKTESACHFFCPKTRGKVIIHLSEDRDDKTGTVVIEPWSRWGAGGVMFMGATKRSLGSSFTNALAKIALPENYIGLLATEEYIDGTPVEINAYAYGADIQITPDGCILNKQAAAAYLLSLSSGAKVIALSNHQDELILWPNGGWLRYRPSDPGLAVGGQDGALKRFYLLLRQRTKQGLPKDNEREREQRIPEKLRKQRA